MIVEWVVIGLFILIGLCLLKLEHHTRKIKIIAILIIGFLLYLSIVSVFKSNEVDTTSPRGIVNGIYFYFGWIGESVSNLWDVGVDVTGRVVDAVKRDDEGSKSKR